MYSVHELKVPYISKLIKVSDIIYKCGKDMANKNGLHHWDNSRVKTFCILLFCALKNRVYLVYNEKSPIATFQTRKTGNAFLFQKLAVLPNFTNGGVGTFCINEIERLARCENCKETICEVYDKSENAKRFYENRGYLVCGEVNTLKYRELRLRKEL